MNNKLLVVIIAIIVVVGAIVLTNNNKTSYTPTQSNVKEEASKATLTKPEDATVTVTSSGFSPQTLTIKSGMRVIWINKSNTTATVNSAVHPTHLVYPPLNLGEFANDSSVQLIFDNKGTYNYHDHLNPSRVGAIIVE